ncbi:hypothetical protein LIER_37844 [Lithospermum erythrorhizon]|uniref:Tify domain-containing protein n=1 Tax=Lithospermum erythrorhizon TaxID=34254 RepID=A0AAV3PRY3_LITER
MPLADGSGFGNNLHPAENQPDEAHAELTIFYAGGVNVYNDISPEKTMFLGLCLYICSWTSYVGSSHNGCSTSSKPPPEAKVQAQAPNYLAQENAFVNTFINTSLCSALSSPMSLSSHPTGQTIGGVI